MKIKFWTNQNLVSTEYFGGLTSDLAGISAQKEQAFGDNLEGEAFYGSYEECVNFAENHKGAGKAAIVLTDDPGEENQFLRKLSSILQCPIVGGGAARNTVHPGEGLASGTGQAAVFLITDPAVKLQTEVKNIHNQILETCQLELADARTIRKINGVDGKEYLEQKKRQYGFAEDDFEHMTLSTLGHINAHLSVADGVVKSGRDLEETMLLRYVKEEEAEQSIIDFYQATDENTIVFGCAGLARLVTKRFSCSCLGTFLYGEICALEQGGDFGNLMLSKIRLSKDM